MIARMFERFSDGANVEISDRYAHVNRLPGAPAGGRISPAVAVQAVLATRPEWGVVGDHVLPELPQVVIE